MHHLGMPERPVLSRRQFLAGSAALLTCSTGGRTVGQGLDPGAADTRIHTVTGPVAPGALGVTLVHEHVLVDFVGAADVSPSRYDADAAFRTILPFLERVRALGCETLIECTPAYLARDVRLLRRLSEASGMTVLTNTGYYGAANDKFLPPHAYTETAAQLADRWTREWEQGIDGTGIKPAFMKIGVDGGPLSAVDAKLVHAAALTHRRTGLPIASHTGDGVAAHEELDLLERGNVPLPAFIWVHAQSEKDQDQHVRAGRRGAWVEFDGVSEKTAVRHVELVVRMKAEGLLGRVLVSQDAGWYRVGEPDGGEFRGYDALFTTFVPALKAAGVTDAEVRQLLVQNPREAFTPRQPGS